MFDVIKFRLHLSREFDVYYIVEVFLKQLGNYLSERRWLYLISLLALDIVAVDDRGDSRRIGRRSADTVFLKLLDEGGFVVACRRLCEVLISEHFLRGELLALFQLRERSALLVVGVLSFLVELGESVELHGIAAALEKAACGCDVRSNGIKDGILHLACHEALPDELVELILVGAQRSLDLIGRQADRGGTYRLVGVLRVVLRFEHPWLLREILRAVKLLDEVCGGSLSLVGDTQRIGSHVGYQTDGAHSCNVDTFVQLLCRLHCTAGLEGIAAARLLLKGRCRKRRSGLLLAL